MPSPAMFDIPNSELIKFIVAWTLVFGGLGALLGKVKDLTGRGFVYGVLWGPIGLSVILLKQPPGHRQQIETGRRRLGRRGRIVMRAGLAVSLLIAFAWVGSALFHTSYVRAYNPPRPVAPNPWSTMGISGQYALRLGIRDSVLVLQNTLWFTGPQVRWKADCVPGLHVETKAPRPVGLIPGKLIPWLHGGPAWSIEIPLWLPFLLFAIPTARLSFLDRPFPPRSCQNCGYDLTGNVSGVCPECGTDTGNGP
jgi:hypothetical protein